jgi:hypothetical protein
VEVAFREPVEVEPERGWLPLQAPLAVQELALVLFHVKVELLPAVIEAGEALKEIVGAGVGGGAGP